MSAKLVTIALRFQSHRTGMLAHTHGTVIAAESFCSKRAVAKGTITVHIPRKGLKNRDNGSPPDSPIGVSCCWYDGTRLIASCSQIT